MKDFFADIGKAILPERLRRGHKQYCQKLGYFEVPYHLYGVLFLLSFLISFLVYILYFNNPFQEVTVLESMFPNFTGDKSTVLTTFFLSFFMLIFLEIIVIFAMTLALSVYYDMILYRRVREIEEVLPDFLQDVSTNLRAGMTFDKSLWNAIKPKYAVLEDEIEIIAKKTMAGYDTVTALKTLGKKYDSVFLQESTDMIIVGLEGGADLSSIIERIVQNVRESYYLKKELLAEISGYITFISIVTLFVAPLLFGLALTLLSIVQSLGETLSSATEGSSGDLPFTLKFQEIPSDDFIQFSYVAIFIISLGSSLIISELREGSIKAGLKYVLFFVPVSLIVYTIIQSTFTVLFGAVSFG